MRADNRTDHDCATYPGLVRLWRLNPKRSLALAVSRELSQGWTEGEWSYRRFVWGLRIRALPILVFPVSVALLITLPPLVVCLGRREPGWFSDAWQVTGVLIGFALALFVFLMEASLDRRLRSAATFRSVIRRTWLEWPLALGLTFILFVAAAARWSDSSSDAASVPGWAETWVWLLFAVQIASFAAVFSRGISLLPTSSLLAVVRDAFRNAAREATYRSLQRRVGTNLFDNAVNAAPKRANDEPHVRHLAFGLEGRPISATKFGEIADVDLALPRKLACMKPVGDVALHPALTDRTQPASYLGHADDGLGRWVDYEVSRGVAVRRRRREPDTQAVFSEAIEFARRALSSGSSADLELSTEVIVGAFTEVAESWKAFGLPHEGSVVREFLRKTVEDEMDSDLRDLAEDFIATGQPRVIQVLSLISYRLMAAGRDHDAPLLIEIGLGLSYAQTRVLQ